MLSRLYEYELRRKLGRMKERCTNKNRHNYYRYGERGITVCDEWNNSFDNFYKWAIENGYKTGLSIERIDNNIGYNPDNCKWIELSQQGKNRSSSWLIEYNGKTQCLLDWSKELGFKRTTIQNRMNNGLTFEEALVMPLRTSFKNYLK